MRNRTKQRVKIANDLTAIPIRHNTMLRHCYELYTNEDYPSTIVFSVPALIKNDLLDVQILKSD
jgi:hypothetical protein